MNPATAPASPLARWIDALLHALSPQPDGSVEAQLLQHFPFAKLGDQDEADTRLRMPTTAHGSL